MKKNNLTMLLLMFLGFAAFAQNADDKKVIADAQKAKTEVLSRSSDMQSYFDDAKAYAIFPNVGKGALIVGAASGNGAVYERGTLVGMASMKQVDVGAQIGGEAYSEIIFFKTDEALQEFMDDDFAFTGKVTAIAITESAPPINLKYNDGVAVFSLPKKGLMAEVSVGGQHFEYTPLK